MTSTFEYQKKKTYFAQIDDTLIDLGVEELKQIGATNVEGKHRVIHFKADQETLYRANYYSRFITRIIAPLMQFPCHSPEELYEKVSQINWTDILDVDQTFSIQSNVSDSKITHSKYAVYKVKDAIADQFMASFQKRPNVDTEEPDLSLSLHIRDNFASLGIDTSGGSLHKRGYRKTMGMVSMHETVGAAIIRLSEWDGTRPLYDPMCGSGTLLSEALMKVCNIPSGIKRRKFGFQTLPDFNQELWSSIQDDALDKIKELPEGLISGSDKNDKAAKGAQSNLEGIQGGENVHITACPFQDLEPQEDKIIVCNPPYGLRTGKSDEMPQLYKELGDFFKQKCKGSTAFVYFGERSLIKNMGLKATRKIPLKNGGLDGRLVKYDMY